MLKVKTSKRTEHNRTEHKHTPMLTPSHHYAVCTSTMHLSTGTVLYKVLSDSIQHLPVLWRKSHYPPGNQHASHF